MGEEEKQPLPPQPPSTVLSNKTEAQETDHQQPQEQSQEQTAVACPFDPSRMIGIIKRKALIKDLAKLYHAECLAYCQELSELQKKWDEPFIDVKTPEDTKKEMNRPRKRVKKLR